MYWVVSNNLGSVAKTQYFIENVSRSALARCLDARGLSFRGILLSTF